MIDLRSISNDVKPLILQAGEIILNSWNGRHFSSQLKDERDIVTETDIEVEEFLRKELTKVLPQAGFIVEEGKTEMNSEFNWTIDPIDGTKYFAAQVPLFFTQVALLRNNEPLVSFIYNPVSKQLFHAIKGMGAYINGKKISKHADTALAHCIIDFDLGAVSGKENEWKYDVFQKISQRSYRVRVTAGYLAPYLPLGMVDISINTAIETPYSIKNITDLAPHKLLLSEAGYKEELVSIGGKSVLIWASQAHIEEIKVLIG